MGCTVITNVHNQLVVIKDLPGCFACLPEDLRIVISFKHKCLGGQLTIKTQFTCSVLISSRWLFSYIIKLLRCARDVVVTAAVFGWTLEKGMRIRVPSWLRFCREIFTLVSIGECRDGTWTKTLTGIVTFLFWKSVRRGNHETVRNVHTDSLKMTNIKCYGYKNLHRTNTCWKHNV